MESNFNKENLIDDLVSALTAVWNRLGLSFADKAA